MLLEARKVVLFIGTYISKIVILFSVYVLDENYVQVLKSRQALMREAVESKVYARMLLENGFSEGANFLEPEV